jgi:hypothetical protein
MFYHLAMAATAEKTEKLCTKCKKNPKAGGENDSNPWCLECRAAYQRDRRETLDWRIERRGLVRGILAMREHVSNYFAGWSGRPFMGNEVSSIVDSLPGPTVAPEDLDEAQKP